MPNRIGVLTAAVLAAVTITACQPSADGGESSTTRDEPAAPAGDEPVARVNGEPISDAVFQAFAEQRREKPAEKLDQKQREKLIRELIDLELLAQEAKRQGLHREPGVAGKLIAEYKTALARELVTRRINAEEISDEAIDKAYEKRVAEMSDEEFKARHILVDTEKEARALIGELDDGADFAELARKHSTAPSAEDGGALGWFGGEEMVEPFAEATAKLEPGSYTSDPVQTEFGWHVIRLDEVREREPPELKSMRGELTSQLRRQRMEDYIAELRKQADIQR